MQHFFFGASDQERFRFQPLLDCPLRAILVRGFYGGGGGGGVSGNGVPIPSLLMLDWLFPRTVRPDTASLLP